MHRTSRPIPKAGAKTVSIGTGDLYIKSNYQDFQRFADVDLAIAADAETTLPSLIEPVRRLVTGEQKAHSRRAARSWHAGHRADYERARDDATYGWDASPISTARLCAEVWAQIKDEDWSLVSPTASSAIGRSGFGTWTSITSTSATAAAWASAMAPRGGRRRARQPQVRPAVGVAPERRRPDHDLGVLWTAAHHKIPVLYVMHNNRGYHQELMHVQRMAARHMRGIDRPHIGTTLREPNIDYAKVAQGMGVQAIGPITDPKDLAPALKRGIAIVKRGEPALIDVVTQGR